MHPTDVMAKSHLITERLRASSIFAQAKTIHIYMATETEVQTDVLIETALSWGKRVAVPMVWDDQLRLFEIHDLSPQQFRVGPLGIREPHVIPYGEIAPWSVDLWILPGVAYDTCGWRLGRGCGYYDRLLAHRWERSPITIAPAFELQICEAIPFDSTDQPVNQIITEERTILCGEKNDH